MDALPNATIRPATTAPKVDDAVGVPKKCWFVAIVNNKTERKCAQKLEKLGYECYVPTQSEIHVWRTGIKKIVDKRILPSMVFVQTTEKERKQSIVTLPYINRFLSNSASAKDSFGKHLVAIIPDNQIQRLKFILGNADAPVEFEPPTFKLGDKVRVVRGGLMSMEGNIVDCENATYFAIRVDYLGVAKVKVKKTDLMPAY